MNKLAWIAFMFTGCLDLFSDKTEEEEEEEEERREGSIQGDCTDGEDNDDDGDIDCDDQGCSDKPACTGDTTSCSGTAPVIEAVECENSGVVDHPDYGELPTFTIRTTASDEDGDLSYYQMYIDFDDTLDGEEDENDNQLDPVEGAIDGDECDIGNANIGVTIYMQGALPASATTYEWFVRVADSLGKTSEPFMVTCTTPDGNGDGDPNQE